MIALLLLSAFEWRGADAQRVAIERDANAHYAKLAEQYERATGAKAPSPSVIIEEGGLSSRHAGRAALGRIRIRTQQPFALTHEVAHQVLLNVCPQASADHLFHEAYAVSTSGELDAWIDDGYVSSTKAAALLGSGDLDTEQARRALVRLVTDGARPNALPLSIERRLKRCASGERWIPMSVAELSAPAEPVTGDAFIALSRHSGELLIKEGDFETPMPFGSTLKAFVGAALQDPPMLAVGADAFWRCGEALPARMSLPEALARSCNGYFLALRKRAQFYGEFGPVLLALGLARLPETMDEAIGLRPTLALSPWSIAQAYRLLAETRPKIIDALRATATVGTLAGFDLKNAALKSGTVRDPQNNVQLGWIVAITADHVLVMARRGRMPRAFAEELSTRLASVQKRELEGPAQVQTFALLELSDVTVSCDGAFVTLPDLRVQARAFRPIGAALCLGRPFVVRFPGMPGRMYAGGFSLSPVPKVETVKARRGSDVIFTTTEARYVAGVMQSEDALIEGEAARALARVILHNVRHSHERHKGRPVCDTTHCQVFQGTPRDPLPLKDLATLAPWIAARGWLPFSRGGTEPWTAERSLAQVTNALGVTPVSLGFDALQVRVRALDDLVERDSVMGCERLRGPLKLLSCPTSAAIDGASVRFKGAGAGHGEGLSVEAAKKANASAEDLLRAAYK